MNNRQTVLVTGYAQAPKGTPMFEVYKWAGIMLEVDVQTNRIVAADSTLIAELSRDFLRRLVVGYDLGAGVEPLLQLMIARLQTPSREALIVAMRSAAQRYAEFGRQLPMSKASGVLRPRRPSDCEHA
jgi:hypothetical protein